MTRLAIIDGTGYLRRSFHATMPTVEPSGAANHAVDAFARMLARVIRGSSSHRVIAGETPGEPTWRHSLHRGYRAGHAPDAPGMTSQLQRLPEMADAFGIPLAQVAGYSYRDIIASYTMAALAAGMEVVIVSSDKSLAQLMRPRVALYCPLARALISDAAIMLRYGAPPAQLAEALALIGDKEDGVPGVTGIGVKGAADLIARYGSVVRALAMAHTMKPGRTREALMAGGPAALLSLRLVTLADDVPLPLPLDALAVPAEPPEGLPAWLTEHGLGLLLREAAE